jgi:hypothetical protein
MYILFGWGKDVKQDGLKYRVTNCSFSLRPDGIAGPLGNCVPGQINVSIEIPPNQAEKPALDLLKFAKGQHDTAKNDGAGKIVIYAGSEVGQPLQEIAFKNAWISSFSSGASSGGTGNFNVSLSIDTADLQVSGIDFADTNKRKVVLGA